eukprot:CAMPEP_0206575174 /NCGR_PEP_ID=MMETSP0325_2-20121206/29905_1 /ASSEMBLY_ACC=CAM_ASM_000347 /TAXON_ID=2866 /ORGANISM="Crypthecodinium cohnii, Strain Seligo" /LENGTH=90 /DNA_ID=CAMNT_0054079961 /DNA_START=66 /DNA_END=339 /DNA_ORIENTATION=+
MTNLGPDLEKGQSAVLVASGTEQSGRDCQMAEAQQQQQQQPQQRQQQQQQQPQQQQQDTRLRRWHHNVAAAAERDVMQTKGSAVGANTAS